MLDSYRDWFDEVLNSDGSTIDTAQLQSDIAGPLAIIALIQLVLGFAYHVGFLMWKQATPGKLVLGLRVRLRDRPGPMPIGTVLLRWAGQFGVGILGLHPGAGLPHVHLHACSTTSGRCGTTSGRPSTTRSRRPTWCGCAEPRSGPSPGADRHLRTSDRGPFGGLVRQSLYGWL